MHGKYIQWKLGHRQKSVYVRSIFQTHYNVDVTVNHCTFIYQCHSTKSTGKETGKTHLCAVHWRLNGKPPSILQIPGTTVFLPNTTPLRKLNTYNLYALESDVTQ